MLSEQAVLAVLIYNALGVLLKASRGRRGPPILEIAILVVEPTAIRQT